MPELTNTDLDLRTARELQSIGEDAAGMNDGITKPVKIGALVEALRRNIRP
jgi:hypothetical protein